ncbi:MAG TPA: efflux RND transporter periplasmic adaptor subunit [Gemmataceae bacterium]|nr:efflux RND transporter periplasmic adaptor subunit [Gemmataceae bacterium]
MTDHQLAAILHQLRRAAAVDAGIGDAELLQRFVAHRDEVSFELLMWRHARLVWNVCRRVLQNGHDAEDAFQVTFLALARQAARIKNRACLVGWLYQVAYRAALAARARRVKRRESPQDVHELRVMTNGEQELSDEDRDALDQEIHRLPERFQIPVVLCYLEGKTVSETALLLGWPRGTVASRLARARGRLRIRLARRGLEFTQDVPTETGGDKASLAIPMLAKQVLAGAARDSVLAPHVASLTKEVMKAMFMTKLKTQAILIVTVLGFILAGGGWAIHLYAVSPEGPHRPNADEPQTQKADEFSKPKPSPEKAAPKTVTVVQPIRREAAPYADYTGRLVALQQVDVQPTVSGRLEKVLFQAGADVRKGDLLFEIDSISFQLSLEKAEAEVERVQTQIAQKEMDLRRAGDLVKKGYGSEKEIINAGADVTEAKAALRQAQLERQRAKLNLAATKITAPMDGRIGEPSVHPGSQVHSGDKPTVLTTITVLDPMGVNFDMDERNFLRYRRLMGEKKVKGPGSAISIEVSDEEGFPRKGILFGFGDRIEPDTGTIRVRGKLANPDGLLLPGMFTRVRMKIGPPGPVVVLPQEAQHFDKAGRAYLLVVNDQNRIETRFVKWDQVVGPKVKSSEQSFDKTEVFMTVTEGLRPDDWVIISDIQGLQSGDEVNVQRVKNDSKK